MNNAEVLIKFKGDTKDVDNSVNGLTKSMGSLTKSITLGNLAAKGISKAFNLIASNMDSAISRVDTMNNFSKVMSNLGVSSKEADKSIKKMSDKLAGLPTTLDQGALAVQRFTSANGDVKKSTNIFLALNNAILAGGASTEIQASALEQLSQAYAKGKPDMMEWRTAMTAMPAQLKQVAKAMGYVNADALGEALRNGSVSMEDFMKTMVQLNEKGIDGFQNFEKQARNSTGGIRTSITVAKTQVVKGIASMIDGLNKGLKKSGMGSISDVIANIGKSIKKVLDKVGKWLSKVDFKKLLKTLKAMLPVVKAIGAAFLTWKAGNMFKNIVDKVSLAKKSLSMFGDGITKVISKSSTLTSALTKIGTKSGLLSNLISKSSIAVKALGTNAAATASTTGVLSTALGGASSIMAALPFVAAAGGVAALGTAIYKIVTYKDAYNKKTAEQVQQTEKVIEAQKKENKQMNDNILKKGAEIQSYKNLQLELKSIVDENGRIKAGYEDRAKTITTVLANALGVEANIVDGVIQNYNDYDQTIGNIIEKKKAQNILNEQEKQYNKAVKESVVEQQKMLTAKKEIEKWTKKVKDAEKEYKEVMKTTPDDKAALNSITARISKYKGYIESQQGLYDKAKKSTQEYTNDIVVYQKNLENFEAGHYDKMITDVQGYVAGLSMSLTKKQKTLQDDLDKEKINLDSLKEMKRKTNDGEIAAAQQRIQVKNGELTQIKAQIVQERTTWLTGTQDTLTQMMGQTFKFKDLGNGYVEAYINGQKMKQPIAYENLEKFGTGIVKSLNKTGVNSEKEAVNLTNKYIAGLDKPANKTKAKSKGKELATSTLKGFNQNGEKFKQVGGNAAKGIAQGATSPHSLSLLRSAGVKMGNALEDGYRSATKTQSPSRVFKDLAQYVPEGIAIGINKNINVVNDAMKNLTNAMTGAMQMNISPQLAATSSLHYSPNVIVNNQMNMRTDPLGQVVGNIKTFANGSKNDYNYGMGS